MLAAVSNHPITVDGYQLPLTVSIGLVTCNAQDTNVLEVTQLLKEADLALYRAKTDGRNRVIVADTTPGSAADRPTEGSYGPDAPAPLAIS
jgi:diguanylate cyclase (GGDEF)-like protein